MNEAGDSTVRAATTPKPLGALTDTELRSVCVLATDVDGTLTSDSVLTADVVGAIHDLSAVGIEVIPVSGRCYGELAGLVRYLPGVKRGIAENGLIEARPDQAPRWLGEAPDVERLRARVRRVVERCQRQLEPAADARIRLGDLAFEREAASHEILVELEREAAREGIHCIWSSVHIHFSERSPDKGRGLCMLLGDACEGVLTMGDAPNDGGLFDPRYFGLSVGTADVADQRAEFRALPRFITSEREGAAFLEVATRLLAVK